MSYHDHAHMFRPEPQRPICYRTHRSLMDRARPILIGLVVLGFVAVLALGCAALIARLQATDAQLDAAYLEGLAAGQTMCRSN
jgi:ligand-binding sensor protein